jgi:DNA-binding GntR family transcriptional regulator
VVDLLAGGVYKRRPVDLGETDPRPYVRLAARLRKEILNSVLTPGHPVPSIITLSRELGHARPTCGKALQLLEQEKLLIRVPGLGYYVARNLT